MFKLFLFIQDTQRLPFFLMERITEFPSALQNLQFNLDPAC